MNRSWYAMYDPEGPPPLGIKTGCFEIDPKDALDLNQDFYGIFWTVNEFNGPRKKENLVRINSWAIDMDHGSKPSQWDRIRKFLIPSLVIESKRGFHVYFHAKDGTPERWNEIVQDRLIHHYQADPRAKDISRVLRVPGFLHCKDPSNLYRVQTVHEHPEIEYSETDLIYYFPESEHLRAKRVQQQELREAVGQSGTNRNDLWELIWSMDCEIALGKLSGTAPVNYETYEFKRQGNGNLNIWVSGKSTSSWIDQEKRIGSMAGGGPTVWQWLSYFGHSHKAIYQIMKSYFPELFRKTGVA